MDNLLKSMLGKGGGGSGIPSDIMASLQALSGGDKGGEDMKGMEKQVEVLWKMLDDMSENDPEAYAKFLKKQADAAKEEVASAKQGQKASFQAMVEGEAMVIIDLPIEATEPQSSSQGQKVALLQVWAAAKKGKLGKSNSNQSIEALGKSFPLPIPFFQLREPIVQAPPPAPHSSPLIPVATSPTIHCYFIATHRDVLDRVFLSSQRSDASVTAKRRSVFAAAACQFIESKHPDIKLSVNRWRIRVSPSLLDEPERKALSEIHHQAKASKAAQGTSAQGLSSSLLGQLTRLGVDTKPTSSGPAASSLKPQAKKGPLISELSPDEGKEIEATISIEGLTVVVKLKLPSASKASDLDIEVDEDGRSLVIGIQGQVEATRVALPHQVEASGEVQAKFDKKSKTLTVSIAMKQ